MNVGYDTMFRSFIYRLGRRIYHSARNETINIPKKNGENKLQTELIKHKERSRSNLIVMDIGANVGEWSCSLISAIQKSAKPLNTEIYAFEAVDKTLNKYKTNICEKYNGNAIKIIASCSAMSSTIGEATVFITGDLAGTNSLHWDGLTNHLESKVKTDTIDNYIKNNNIGHIDFIKVDTEGHDLEVIRGGHLALQKEIISVVQFEYNHRWVFARNYIKDVFDFLENLPYTVGKLTPKGIELYEKWHPEIEKFVEGNYIIIHNDLVDEFKCVNLYFDNHNAMSTHIAQ